MKTINVAELAQWIAQSGSEPPNLLDVREQWEWDLAHIASSVHIPMGEITSRFNELESAKPLVCICHHGMRSMQVAQYLERQGFSEVFNLTGGIDAWSKQVDETIARY